MSNRRAEEVKVYVHREADGYLLSIDTNPPDKRNVEVDDTVTEQYVWIVVDD